jgi:hypothetical protein
MPGGDDTWWWWWLWPASLAHLVALALGLYGAWALGQAAFRQLRFVYTQYFRRRLDLAARCAWLGGLTKKNTSEREKEGERGHWRGR